MSGEENSLSNCLTEEQREESTFTVWCGLMAKHLLFSVCLVRIFGCGQYCIGFSKSQNILVNYNNI